MPGFGNAFASEAVPGSLPVHQNSPQQCPKGLYAEQLSGTAFTAPRVFNQRSWLYRIRPSANHKPFAHLADQGRLVGKFDEPTSPKQYRWMPPPMPDAPTDFLQGLHTLAGAGDVALKTGMAVHLYLCNTSMTDKAFCNADGDMLLVAQQGVLDIRTEFGMIEVHPGQIAVIQRGIRFSVAVEGTARGWVCELFQGHFRLPDLGPIGSNGLANARDFQTPVAAYEDIDRPYTVVHKFLGSLHAVEMDHSPFDVVAWHGNYAPYKYDLSHFNCINSVTYDHPDPSIYTVLTAPTSEPGVAACDFVIFPPRWMVQEHTFRPPWFHRNCMSELMGNIRGVYDAKEGGGFVPGGSSLHSCMSPHGPDASTFDKASVAELKPVRMSEDSLAFMFESTYLLRVTAWGAAANVDEDYWKCWQGFKKNFQP